MSRSSAIDLLGAAEQARLKRAPEAGWREPMLATLTDRRFSDAEWVFERKLDGVRAIVCRDGGRAALFSRNHNSIDASYPELLDALSAQSPQRFVADGEIVAFDGAQTSFAKLQSRIHRTRPEDVQRSGVAVFLYLFDLLVIGEVDVTGLGLRARKALLREAFDFTDPLRFSAHRNGSGESYFAEACANGWEGLIAKRADAPYRPGRRSPDWLKFKCVREQEFVIGGFTDPGGSRVGFGALLVGYYDDDRLRYAGKVGTGYNDRMLRDLRRQLDALTQPSCPFSTRVREPGSHWVRPQLVAQVGFNEWTTDGKLRHPRFIGLRTDKAPRDVVREAVA